MVAGTISIKTPQGQAGLATRQRRVSQRHRTVLFLIDGKRSAPEVRSLALLRAVRAEAQLGGSLTLLRLRRARHLPGIRIGAPLAPA